MNAKQYKTIRLVYDHPVGVPEGTTVQEVSRRDDKVIVSHQGNLVSIPQDALSPDGEHPAWWRTRQAKQLTGGE